MTGSISGQVLIDGSGAAGIRVALSNGSSATTSTGGFYSFVNIPGGSYTVSISSVPSDATCPTTSQSATISATNTQVTVNFDCAFIRTASIFGAVFVGDVGLSGVTVELSGTVSASTITTSDGQFVFGELRAGSYILSLGGFDVSSYIFSTTSRSVTIGVGETAFVDFPGMLLSLNTVSAGGSHSCALVSGSAFCWGRGVDGQLGTGAFGFLALAPAASASGLVFRGLAAGSNHTCGVTEVGDAYCWGDGGNGRLGGGSSTDSSLPVLVSGGLAFFSVSAGAFHTCGVTDGLAAYCWGSNNNGKLGDASGSSSSVPVLVSGGLTFASVSAGSQHTCGVTSNGDAYCWGSNGNGRLGDGSTTSSDVPVRVSGGLVFASVSAASSHTCGVTTDGAAYCWGSNGNGRLGDGSTTDSSVPVLVSGFLGFASVSAGRNHTCGVTFGGAAYCWGSNGSGRLGDGSTVGSTVPVPVSGGLAFASLSLGANHTCGVTTGGPAYCWGSNFYGQLGDAGWFFSSTPVQVSGGLTFRSVDAGFFHTCGVASNGTGYCWGSNTTGKMGNGMDYFQPMPMPILLTSPVLAGSTRPPNYESRSHLLEVAEWEDERFRESLGYRDSGHEPIRPRRRR